MDGGGSGGVGAKKKKGDRRGEGAQMRGRVPASA